MPEQSEMMVSRARRNYVRRIVCIGTDPEDSLNAREFANAHENVCWTYGVHPENAEAYLAGKFRGDYDAAINGGNRPIAIGEVGLDYHQIEENPITINREAQIKVFEEMLDLAVRECLPVSFHIREAYDDFFGIIDNFPMVRGVVHCFTDSKKNMRRIINETGLYVGVNGVMTYSTLALPPLDRALLETDAPFLAPLPYRGIINEPAYIRNVGEWLADKLGVSFELVEHQTTKNAEDLFGFTDLVLRK
ncbi:TatD family hydrolase [Candidatus Saccharibacteria bacterium]|nr:TatD family hydrolase [Candidatus Saccharibacteria bacterium]